MGSNGVQKNLKYGFTEKTVIEGWAKNYPCAMTYLSTLNSRQESAAISLFHFCTWSKLDPNQLLAMKDDRNCLDAEKLLDSLKDAEVIFPPRRKWHVVAIVRGFFRSNYKALEQQAGRGMAYNPQEPHSLPTKVDRRALFKACYNPRDKTLIMFGCCTALALEALSELRWSHFEENWQDQDIPNMNIPSALLKGHGKGKYKQTRQLSFLTPEAKQVVIEYRDWMTQTFSYQWKETDHVFLSVKRNIGEPLTKRMISKISTKISQRAGVEFSLHDSRRIVQTALENAGCSQNWIKKAKGRKVSGEESPYSKPSIEQLRQKYREALPDLKFLHDETQAKQTAKLTSEMDGLKKEFAETKLALDIIKTFLTEEQLVKLQLERLHNEYRPPKVLAPIRMADYEKKEKVRRGLKKHGSKKSK